MKTLNRKTVYLLLVRHKLTFAGHIYNMQGRPDDTLCFTKGTLGRANEIIFNLLSNEPMTMQNAIILQSFLRAEIFGPVLESYLKESLGYNDAKAKLEEIFSDLDGDVELGRGKEAEERAEREAQDRPEPGRTGYISPPAPGSDLDNLVNRVHGKGRDNG